MRPLAPHDADLVEADARQLYEASTPVGAPGRTCGWSDAPDYVRDVFRAIAANPYRRDLSA